MLLVDGFFLLDHPSDDFLAHYRRSTGRDDVDVVRPTIEGSWARVQVLLSSVSLSVSVFRTAACRRHGLRDDRGLAAEKFAVAYCAVSSLIRRYRPTALLVTSDLVHKAFAAAAAASGCDLPVWLLVHNTRLPKYRVQFPVVGAFVYRAHDACMLSPQPAVVAEYPRHALPVQRDRLDGGVMGVVLHSKCPATDELLALIEGVAAASTIARLFVRPHPSDRRDWSWLESRSSKVQVVSSRESLSAFAAEIDVGVVTIPWTSAVGTLLDLRTPTYWLPMEHYRLLDYNPEALVAFPVDPAEIEEVLSKKADRVVRRDQECGERVHPHLVSFATGGILVRQGVRTVALSDPSPG